MKQLSKLRNIATRLAFFAVMAVAMFALSPKAFAATSIDIGGITTTAPASFPVDLQAGVQWTNANTLTLTNATITNYVKIDGDIKIVLVGTNTITSTNTAKDIVNGALHVTGATTIQGASTADSLTATGAHPQDGIYIGSSSSSSISADQALTIKTATISATGGTSSANIGRNGISCGSLAIDNASVNGIGGNGVDPLNLNDRAGGDGISVSDGQININKATINVTGGNGNDTGGGGHGLDFYVSASSSADISDTTITVKGGTAGKSGSNDGGSGLYSFRDLTLVNCTIKSATGGYTAGTGKAGYGIYVHDSTLTLNNTTITTAKGGSGKSPKDGIGMTSGKLILENGSTINATGGDGTTNSAGSGVLGSVELNDTSKLTATGGNATGAAGITNTAGYGVIGSVTLNSDDIVLSAIGGTGGNTPGWGILQVATITPTPTLLDAYVGSSGFTTKVDLADPADPLLGTYNQNRYVYISKGAPPTPSYTPTLVQKPARDVIYPTARVNTSGNVYTFQSTGPYSEFSGVWIHGYAIPSSYYTAFMNADGSVSITLADWYVRTLNYGEEYLLHIVFNSGYGITKFYR